MAGGICCQGGSPNYIALRETLHSIFLYRRGEVASYNTYCTC